MCTRILYGALAVTSAVGLLMLTWYVRKDGLGQVGAEHAPAVVGLPAAIAVATGLVSLFRAFDGQFRLELPGLKVVGAAGALVGWLACVDGLAFAVRILW
jgi:hypothetical protein